MIRNRRTFGLHLDAWAALAFGVGYFYVQPILAGYRMVTPWGLT